MKITALILAFIIVTSAFAGEEKINDQVRYISEQDRSMNAAISHAQNTLDDFLLLSKSPPPGASGFKLKVMLSDENGVEHLWFSPFNEIKGGFAGVLVNEPEVISSVSYGKVYAFKKSQITDWGYVQDGKQKGSFTVCVLFKTMDKETVNKYKRDYGFECNP
jgi:uncharacterized protein YegJ (DUF2314 family)